jgi:hypothetical protein
VHSSESPYVERIFSTSMHSIRFLTLGSSSIRRFMASWFFFGLPPFVFGQPLRSLSLECSMSCLPEPGFMRHSASSSAFRVSARSVASSISASSRSLCMATP